MAQEQTQQKEEITPLQMNLMNDLSLYAPYLHGILKSSQYNDCDVNFRNGSTTPLIIAIRKLDHITVGLLLDRHKANPNYTSLPNPDCLFLNDRLETPLSIAISQAASSTLRYLEIATKLIGNGASINAIDSMGMTSLDHLLSSTSLKTNIPVLEFLIENGANIVNINSINECAKSIKDIASDPDEAFYSANFKERLKLVLKNCIVNIDAVAPEYAPIIRKIQEEILHGTRTKAALHEEDKIKVASTAEDDTEEEITQEDADAIEAINAVTSPYNIPVKNDVPHYDAAEESAVPMSTTQQVELSFLGLTFEEMINGLNG